MRNPIASPLPRQEIEKILRDNSRRRLLPSRGAREWREAAGRAPVAAWIAQVREGIGKQREAPLPALPDELYAAYSTTGYRLGFERVYFERRRLLARAAVDWLFTDDGDPARDEIEASFLAKLEEIAGEESWALPAHVHTATGKDPWQIDLFAAETANLMGECLDVFGHSIPEDLRRRILDRLTTNVFENYLRRHDEFVWTSKTNNWNAVCHQGILGAALAVETDPARLAALLEIASGYLKNFLDGFTPDGGCTEGPTYWQYGFGWFSVLNEQLETRSHNQLSLFEGSGHVRRIARYGPLISLSRGNHVNFSDCRASGGFRPQLLRYLGLRLNDRLLLDEGALAYRRLRDEGLPLEANRCDLFHLLRLFLYCPDEIDDEPERDKPDVFFPDLQVLVARGRTSGGKQIEFAAKGGHNGEHHNHNDCGSFLLRLDGESIISEIGQPEYNRSFFGPDRYESIAARSLGHSVPLINGFEQPPGREFAARILASEQGGDEVRFLAELTNCYPLDAGCRLVLRLFILQKKAGILEVEDQIELERPEGAETAIMTLTAVERRNNDAILVTANVSARLEPAAGTLIDRVEEHTCNDHRGSPVSIRRIVLKPASLEPEISLRYRLHLG